MGEKQAKLTYQVRGEFERDEHGKWSLMLVIIDTARADFIPAGQKIAIALDGHKPGIGASHFYGAQPSLDPLRKWRMVGALKLSELYIKHDEDD